MSAVDFSLPEGITIQNPPDDGILLSIGKVAYQWAFLEELFHQGILQARGLDPTSLENDFKIRKETQFLNISERAARLLRSAKERISEEEFQKLKEHCDYIIGTVSKKRHRTVHGVWVGTNRKDLSLRLTFDMEKGEQIPLMKAPSDIRGVEEEILTASEILCEMLAEFNIRR